MPQKRGFRGDVGLVGPFDPGPGLLALVSILLSANPLNSSKWTKLSKEFQRQR